MVSLFKRPWAKDARREEALKDGDDRRGSNSLYHYSDDDEDGAETEDRLFMMSAFRQASLEIDYKMSSRNLILAQEKRLKERQRLSAGSAGGNAILEEDEDEDTDSSVEITRIRSRSQDRSPASRASATSTVASHHASMGSGMTAPRPGLARSNSWTSNRDLVVEKLKPPKKKKDKDGTKKKKKKPSGSDDEGSGEFSTKSNKSKRSSKRASHNASASSLKERPSRGRKRTSAPVRRTSSLDGGTSRLIRTTPPSRRSSSMEDARSRRPRQSSSGMDSRLSGRLSKTMLAPIPDVDTEETASKANSRKRESRAGRTRKRTSAPVRRSSSLDGGTARMKISSKAPIRRSSSMDNKKSRAPPSRPGLARRNSWSSQRGTLAPIPDEGELDAISVKSAKKKNSSKKKLEPTKSSSSKKRTSRRRRSTSVENKKGSSRPSLQRRNSWTSTSTLTIELPDKFSAGDSLGDDADDASKGSKKSTASGKSSSSRKSTSSRRSSKSTASRKSVASRKAKSGKGRRSEKDAPQIDLSPLLDHLGTGGSSKKSLTPSDDKDDDDDPRKAEIVSLQQQLSEALLKVVSITEEQIRGKDEFLKVSTEVSQLKGELSEATRDRDDFKQKLEESQATVKKNDERIEKLEYAVERSLDEHDRLNLKLDRAHDDYHKLLIETQDMEDKLKDFEGMEASGVCGGAGSEKLREELKDAKKLIVDKDREIEEQKHGIEHLEKELKESTAVSKIQVDELEAEKRAVEGKLKAEIAELRADVDKKNDTIAALEKQLEGVQPASGNDDLASVRAELVSAKSELNIARSDSERVARVSEKMKSEKEDLIERNNSLNEQLKVMGKDVTDLTAKSKELEGRVLELTKKSYDWKIRAEKAEEKLSEVGGGEEAVEMVDERAQSLFLQSVMDKKANTNPAPTRKSAGRWGFGWGEQKQEPDVTNESIRIKTLEEQNAALLQSISDLKSDMLKSQLSHKTELYSSQAKIEELQGKLGRGSS